MMVMMVMNGHDDRLSPHESQFRPIWQPIHSLKRATITHRRTTTLHIANSLFPHSHFPPHSPIPNAAPDAQFVPHHQSNVKCVFPPSASLHHSSSHHAPRVTLGSEQTWSDWAGLALPVPGACSTVTRSDMNADPNIDCYVPRLVSYSTVTMYSMIGSKEGPGEGSGYLR